MPTKSLRRLAAAAILSAFITLSMASPAPAAAQSKLIKLGVPTGQVANS